MVDTPHEDRDVEVLDEAECLALMATMSLGRIAYTEGALPAVQPVAFALGDGEVFVATHRGSNVAVASRGAVVAFEVDDFDAGARTGWTVTVVGASRVISDADEVGRLDEFGVQPWAPAAGHCYIGIQTRLVRGRRISRRASPLGSVPVVLDGSPPAALPA
jgi:nitroimidazol reductase NimA-like FMN-containing flavoprotein (pyridoxamine 5'-phosphate oxidase superfamily)